MPLEPIGNRVVVRRSNIKLGSLAFLVEERSIPGQDDRVYEKSRVIWEEVTRGQADITATNVDNEEGVLVCSLRGLRKFGYSDSTYGEREKVSSVVAIDKENGECAHVSAFEYHSQKFWVVGSKHVHMVLRDVEFEADLKTDVYENQRYRVATVIAALFLRTLRGLEPRQKELLFEKLASNKWTANAEAILATSQHIVDYNGVSELRWFAISRSAPVDEGLCISPDDSQDVFRQCGLHAITRTARILYPSDEFNRLLEQIGQRSNSEGVVVYGSDESGKVVRLWKEKSYPYTMERVCREAIKRGMVGEQLHSYVMSRLKQQKPELRRFFATWEHDRLPFLIQFAAWIAEKFPQKNRDAWSISCRWLTLQREFSVLSDEARIALAERHHSCQLSGVSSINAIVLVGPPGSGKSTLARSLTALLQRCGKMPVWLNQDEAGNRKAYLDAIKRNISMKETTHVLLDKSNMEKGNRDDYTQLGLLPTLTVVFAHPDGSDALEKLCVDRIMARGDAHRSLYPGAFSDKRQDPRKELKKIISSFIQRSDIEESMDATCVTVDATMPPAGVLSNVWAELAAADPSIPPLEAVEASIAQSVTLSEKYEQLLQNLSVQQQLFAAVKIDKNEMSKVIAKVPKAALSGKELRNEFHITVKYFGGVVDPAWFVSHAEQLGQPVDVHVVEIVFDDKGVAAVVEKTFPCANAVAHITIACAPRTPPVYSNSLVEQEKKNRLAVDIRLSGVNVFM